jgi:hypothetical protein
LRTNPLRVFAPCFRNCRRLFRKQWRRPDPFGTNKKDKEDKEEARLRAQVFAATLLMV